MDNLVVDVKQIKIAFLIRDLGSGGAERQLVLLANELSKCHKVIIITFYSHNSFYSADLNKNIEFITLDKKGRWDFLTFFVKFYRVMKLHKPSLLYAFMHTAEFLGYLYHFFNKDLRIVWGIRSSNMDITRYGMLYRILRKIECNISHTADKIISNSFAGKDHAIKDGFAKKNIQVVHNGIETDRFKFNSGFRSAIRKQLGIQENALVIGLVARHDPMKGIDYFLEAASIFSSSNTNTYFFIIGSGPETYTNVLKKKAEECRMLDRILWIKASANIEQYYSAMDIYTSSSIYGEGFSNTIGEAMSCNLPCVVTNVGDSSIIVSSSCIVVEPYDALALADGWEKIQKKISDENFEFDDEPRMSICNNFSIEKMVLNTEQILLEAIALK
jgi:glycosyltransferase involved in cell wall biosynthesis